MKSKKHRSITGGQAIVKTLEKNKVKYVFGLIGSATMELFDALYDNKKIKFIDVRDERTGTHITDGYARASGKVGVMVAGQNGPGVTNLVTGVAQAYKAFSPIITLGGDIASDHCGKDSFQEIDQQRLFVPITKKTFKINNSQKIPFILDKAFNTALSGRPGPVHINFPRDSLSKKTKFKYAIKRKKIKMLAASDKDIKKIYTQIIKYPKTVIIAGGGIKNTKCYKDVIIIAKNLYIPIVSSAGHGDAIPFNEKLYLGQMGPRGNKVATKSVKDADLILALGTRLLFIPMKILIKMQK